MGRHFRARPTMSTLAFARERLSDSPPVITPADGGEVERLRRLIDSQPICLLRLATDSVVLAANGAALGQLAASDLGQVWGTALVNRFPLEQQGRWDEFVEHVRENGAASNEFSLQDLEGNVHSVLLQGVNQPGHPDGVESMIVAVRDISSVKRLEQTLQDLSGVQNALTETRSQLEEIMADQQRLLGTLAERDAELWRLAAEHASDEARVRTLTEEHRLALESKDRQWQQQLDALRREVEEASTARVQLEEQLAEQEEGRRALEARKAAEASQLAAVLANAVKATVMAHRLVQAIGRSGGASPANEAPVAIPEPSPFEGVV